MPTAASSVDDVELDARRPGPRSPRALSDALDAPVEQPRPDAAAPVVRVDLALDLVHRRCRRGRSARRVLRRSSRPSTSTRTMSSNRSLPSFVSMSICRFRRVGSYGHAVGGHRRGDQVGRSARSRRRRGRTAPGAPGSPEPRPDRAAGSARSWPSVGDLGVDVIARLRTCVSMCSLTDLWMIFQVRRCSARARGSPSRAARAISRSSLRWLARRSSVSRPSASAARTAQPGSPS